MKRKRIIAFVIFLISLIAYVAWFFWAGPMLIVAQIHNHNAKTVRLFCLSGVSPNRDAWMIGGVFHCAVASGNQDIVKMMIAHSANVDRVDGYGTTPLDIATSRGDLEMMRLLVNHGADISKRNRDGETALDIAIREKLDDSRIYLEQLVQKIKGQ